MKLMYKIFLKKICVSRRQILRIILLRKGAYKMNLILCSENCKHQKDGYCCLDEYGRITDVISSPCVYFDERKDGKHNDKNGESD